MNGIDIAILIIMGLSCLMGIVRGFTKEVLGLFTWAGAAFAAYMTYPLASEFARGHIANPMIADSVTGVVLFILYLIVFSIITFNISNAVRSSSIGGLDRGLGLAFGVIRGSILICAAEIAFSLFINRESQSETIQSARFIPMVRRGADEMLLMMPTKWREMLDQQTKNLQALGKTAGETPTQLFTPVNPQGTTGTNPQNSPTINGKIYNPSGITPGSAGEDQQHSSQQSPQQKPTQQGMTFPGQLPSGSVPSSSSTPHTGSVNPLEPQQTTKTPVPGATSRGTTPFNRDQTADSLSNLKPTAADMKGNEGTYDKRQQRELDRLIEASE